MTRRKFIKFAAGSAVLAAAGGGGIMWYMDTPQFGALPAGDELARVVSSPNYSGGVFHNLVPDPPRNRKFFGAYARFLFGDKQNTIPPCPVPSCKVDLRNEKTNRLIWFGHSSFMLQMDGRSYLLDPVLSQRASPVPGTVKAFPGSYPYDCADMPEIDWLMLTHDHWDHLDYATLVTLKSRIRNIVCPLGVDAHLLRWGFASSNIHPLDWGDSLDLGRGTILHCVTAHHFSGRSFTRNKSLWGGYYLQTPATRLYFSGDGGYGPHFSEIGQKYGAPDIAFLDCGQYDKCWPHAHMVPEQSAQAALDLGARALFPAHCGKFSLALHPWNDPLKRATSAASGSLLQLVTPIIGEPVALDAPLPSFAHWWENMG